MRQYKTLGNPNVEHLLLAPKLDSMELESARKGLGRAERMFTALCARASEAEEEAFEDRLPYVLDLFAGVRRQINDGIPRGGPTWIWWSGQLTAGRKAITEMRHAQLKRLERGARRHVYTHSFASMGTYNGKTVQSGDTVVSWRWYFMG